MANCWQKIIEISSFFILHHILAQQRRWTNWLSDNGPKPWYVQEEKEMTKIIANSDILAFWRINFVAAEKLFFWKYLDKLKIYIFGVDRDKTKFKVISSSYKWAGIKKQKVNTSKASAVQLESNLLISIPFAFVFWSLILFISKSLIVNFALQSIQLFFVNGVSIFMNTYLLHL